MARKEALHTIKEAAHEAGVSIQVLYRAAYSGKLRLFSLGPRRLRVPESALRQYIRENMQLKPFTIAKRARKGGGKK